MNLDIFELERTQSLWENTVEYNLTETGLHPFTLGELLSADELREVAELGLGYGQTNGSIELREAISALYPGTDREQVMVTSGSIEANFVAGWSLLEPGDELILMLPNYMQLWGAARAFGVDVKPFQLHEEDGWQPDVDEIRALVSSKTKMIAVCNPNNPTGALLSEESRAGIVEIAASCGAWLYADEVYRGAELSGPETPSLFGAYEKTLVSHGLSKAYAMPGLRIGWLVGPHKEIADIWARRDYTTITTGIVSNYVAARVLQPARRSAIMNRNRQLLGDNLPVLQNWASSHGNMFSYRPPQAGAMAFMKYDMPINSTELVTRLRLEKSTFLVAGDCFGMDHRLRIGIGGETSYLTEGLDRVSEFFAEGRHL